MTHPPTPPRPTSHNGFALACRPDECIIALVAVLAGLSLAAGFLVVMYLPLPGPVRGLFFLAWAGWSLVDSRRWCRSAGRLARLRLGVAGDWRGLDRDGIWQPLVEAPGALVTSRFLWLRFRLPDGRLAALALTRLSLPAAGWRRLQAALRTERAGH